MAIAAVMRSRARQRLAETEPNYDYAQRPVWDMHITDREDSPVFTFVDVLPKVNRFSLFQDNSPTSHPFRSIIRNTNKWLSTHLDYEVVNCETISMPLSMKMSDCRDRSMGSEAELIPWRTAYQVPMNSDDNIYIRFLRIWIRRRSSEAQVKRAQKINYLDFRPRKVPTRNGNSSKKFVSRNSSSDINDNSWDKDYKIQSLAELADEINQLIGLGQIPGTIISVETVTSPCSLDWGEVPVEQTTFLYDRRFMMGLRVYFDEFNSTAQEDPIDIRDFVPRRLSGGSIFKKPIYESMSVVIDRAERWLAQNPEVTLLNGQTIETKHRSKNFDSGQLAHSDQGDYIRIFRMVFLRSPDHFTACRRLASDSDSDSDEDSFANQPPPAPVYMANKQFVPHEDRSSLVHISESMNKWICQNIALSSSPPNSLATQSSPKGLKILFAETVNTYTKTHHRSAKEAERYTDVAYQTGRFGIRGADMNISIRLYYDEGYFRASDRENNLPPSPSHSTFTMGSTFSLLPPPPPPPPLSSNYRGPSAAPPYSLPQVANSDRLPEVNESEEAEQEEIVTHKNCIESGDEVVGGASLSHSPPGYEESVTHTTVSQ